MRDDYYGYWCTGWRSCSDDDPYALPALSSRIQLLQGILADQRTNWPFKLETQGQIAYSQAVLALHTLVKRAKHATR